jgi:hypothetical protein
MLEHLGGRKLPERLDVADHRDRATDPLGQCRLGIASELSQTFHVAGKQNPWTNAFNHYVPLY